MSSRPYEQYSDEQLAARLAQRDMDALDEAYRRFSSRLLGYVTKAMGGGRAVAADIVHDTFIRVVDHIAHFDPSRSLSTWLFSIATNRMRDMLRTRTRRRELSPCSLSNAHCTQRPLEAVLDASKVHDVLNDRHAGFSDDDRLLIHLRFGEQMRVAEIAEVLGIPIGTAKSRLHYLLRALAERLAPRKGGDV